MDRKRQPPGARFPDYGPDITTLILSEQGRAYVNALSKMYSLEEIQDMTDRAYYLNQQEIQERMKCKT